MDSSDVIAISVPVAASVILAAIGGLLAWRRWKAEIALAAEKAALEEASRGQQLDREAARRTVEWISLLQAAHVEASTAQFLLVEALPVYSEVLRHLADQNDALTADQIKTRDQAWEKVQILKRRASEMDAHRRAIAGYLRRPDDDLELTEIDLAKAQRLAGDQSALLAGARHEVELARRFLERHGGGAGQ